MNEHLDITTLVTEMLTTQALGPDKLAIWGGEFEGQHLEAFLKLWAEPFKQMPWSLWQWTDDLVWGHKAVMPENLDYLERGHVFGEAGDLELRRNGASILWHFVGDDGKAIPQDAQKSLYGAEDYWNHHDASQKLRPYDRSALLWGQYVPDVSLWYEDRVGKAHLHYPALDGTSVVQIRYTEYLYGDSVELVRWRKLEAGKPREKVVNNG